MTQINTGAGYTPYVGNAGATGGAYQTTGVDTGDTTGTTFANRTQALGANGAIGDNLQAAAGGGGGQDLSNIASLPPDQRKKALEQAFPGNADAIEKMLSQHPNVDLNQLSKLDKQSLGQLVQACNQHPNWDPNSLVTTDSKGQPQVSEILKNQQAMDLMAKRTDIQPQDLEKIQNSCKTATASQDGSSDSGAADQMFGDAIKLLSTRTDVKPDDVNELIGKTQSYFGGGNQPNQGQAIANGFEKVTNAMIQRPGMTAANMEGMMSTLQNHFKDPKQRDQAFDSGLQIMDKSGNDPTALDNMLVNSERQGKDGPAKLKDFQKNVQAVANGTANIAGVSDAGGFAKGTPDNPADKPGQTQPGQPGEHQTSDPRHQDPNQGQGNIITGQANATTPAAGAGPAFGDAGGFSAPGTTHA